MVARAKSRAGGAGYHHFLRRRGPVAQLGARLTGSQEVRGSNPLGSTKVPTMRTPAVGTRYLG